MNQFYGPQPMLGREVYVRLVGTALQPFKKRWWMWVPPWCVLRPRPARVAWQSSRYRTTMVGDTFSTRNACHMEWDEPWPPGLRITDAHVEDDSGALLASVPFDAMKEPLPGDKVALAPGGIILRWED